MRSSYAISAQHYASSIWFGRRFCLLNECIHLGPTFRRVCEGFLDIQICCSRSVSWCSRFRSASTRPWRALAQVRIGLSLCPCTLLYICHCGTVHELLSPSQFHAHQLARSSFLAEPCREWSLSCTYCTHTSWMSKRFQPHFWTLQALWCTVPSPVGGLW